MPVQKKPAMKKPAAVMKTPAMKRPARKPTPKATTDSDVARSGSNSPMPPMPDELQQLQAGLDRSAQDPEILEEASHALGEPGTPEMDPLGLAQMEAVLDRALQEAPTTPAAKPAPKPIAGPDSDSPWATQSSDSDSSQTLELPGSDDLPKGQMLAKSVGEILEKAR